jgi:phosphoglycerate dehydrogenase-like enzyme
VTSPKIAVAPFDEDIAEAVGRGGGRVVDLAEADALVWTDALDAQGLKETLERTPPRWVQLPFAGIERFVAAGAVTPGPVWTCTKGVYGPATAEHALALILAAARSLHVHVKASSWEVREELERRLDDSIVVLVGTGGIGRALMRMLGPLGARVVAVNRTGKPVEGAAQTFSWQDLGEVLPEADFVVLAAPLTEETRCLIDEEALALFKTSAWLVNVARGGLVDTAALVAALEEDRIGGAAVDVTDPEPLPDGHPLWSLDNAIITPHVANTWRMALPELIALVERNVGHFAREEPLEGVVDLSLGY